jgi:ATP-dependent phosphofructokinase / diphosphate-dependent phosphofructokinase
MVDLLVSDKRNNPSNYALVILSEGAQWEGFTVQEYGDADAFGHRKKMSVAEDLSEQLIKRTKNETVVSDLTYDLRSGDPDFTDKLIASTFGTIALDAVLAGESGKMAAIQNGTYSLAEIPDPKLGPRRVDIETMYNKERYRPNYSNKLGLPVFLTKA